VGVVEKLAAEGSEVILAVNGVCPAASIQNYVRDSAIARLHKLGITVLPFSRLFGAEGRTVYLVHTASQEAMTIEDVDTLVASIPNVPNDELFHELKNAEFPVHLIGDALTPRTAEEAVFEGLQVAVQLLNV
jgi:hypothetical protein